MNVRELLVIIVSTSAVGGEVIGVSEGYSTADARDRGIESVKRNAPIAEIVDLT
ncbi:YegP family protein [Chitinophaga sedimenti]|uniref:YegP family protein n=1 Tax=Chitinophaga sedimenti TaxID=2033606 RepID=UPI00200307D5|nr:YegP family protein [Chitinophaga sedimenti]MCK7559792.1 YegP family protein [Chitinophaga sedimenti]